MSDRRKTKPVTFRLYNDQEPRLAALAGKTDKDKSELVRMAIEALLDANGIDDDFVRRWDATRAQRIVIVPTSAQRTVKAQLGLPDAAAGGSSGSAEVHCLADWAAGQAEVRRWRDSNPRCASPARVRVRKTRAA